MVSRGGPTVPAWWQDGALEGQSAGRPSDVACSGGWNPERLKDRGVGYFTFVRQRTAFRFFRFSAGALFTGAGVLREDLHPVPSVVGRAHLLARRVRG